MATIPAIPPAVLVIAYISISRFVKHSGSQGYCSSGSDYKPRKKKLKNVIATKVFVVDGMHCEKCASRATEIVNFFQGNAGVVDLKKGIDTVSCE